MNRPTLLLAIALSAAAFPVFAQNVPPVVMAQLPDATVYVATLPASIDVSNYFSDPDVSDAVRLTTVVGNIDIALLGSQKPGTVANFLKYVDQGRYFIQ